MSQIQVTLRNFGPFPNGDRIEQVSYIRLLKAAITSGHVRGGIFRDGRYSAFEAIQKVAGVARALTIRDGHFFPTNHYRCGVGTTAKGDLSQCVGNAICGLLAERIAHVPWVLDYEVYALRYNVRRQNTNRRPDYFGKTNTDQWFVFEAKGRTASPSAGEWAQWKEQSTAVTHVQGTPVTCGLASLALIDGDNELVAIWDDPDPGDESESRNNLEIPTESFFRLYYEPIHALMEFGEPGGDEPTRTFYIPQIDLHIGLHEDVLSALQNGDYSALNQFATDVLSRDDSAEAEFSDQMLFSDGVFIKLGPNWRRFVEQSNEPPFFPILPFGWYPLALEQSKFGTPHSIRDELTEMVIKDLLGPAGGPEEELDQREDRVTGRYLVGMLAPKATPVDAGS